VGLMDHLANHEVICPQPMKMDGGGMIAEVNGKPACIVTRLPGEPEPFPEEEECHIVGRVLAGIHVAGVEYDAGLESWRGRGWRERFAVQLRPKLSHAENELIESENRYQGLHDDSVLPQGILHGDLFHDNVLWDDDGHGGVIDFYFACDDVLLYDVAIAVNDWCLNKD